MPARSTRLSDHAPNRDCVGLILCGHVCLVLILACEANRDSRRLETLRNWSHEMEKQILSRASRAGGTVGLGSAGRTRFTVIDDHFDFDEDRLSTGDAAQVGPAGTPGRSCRPGGRRGASGRDGRAAASSWRRPSRCASAGAATRRCVRPLGGTSTLALRFSASGSPPRRARTRFSWAASRACASVTYQQPPSPMSWRLPSMVRRCIHCFDPPGATLR